MTVFERRLLVETTKTLLRLLAMCRENDINVVVSNDLLFSLNDTLQRLDPHAPWIEDERTLT